ncbi:hypothetical protein TNCV_2658351 [Trichonephila clavipes]|nr:hypothetical protein TNCV_2658351 [Trichonephila clavipes]
MKKAEFFLEHLPIKKNSNSPACKLEGLSSTNIKAELDSTLGESAPSFTTVQYWDSTALLTETNRQPRLFLTDFSLNHEELQRTGIYSWVSARKPLISARSFAVMSGKETLDIRVMWWDVNPVTLYFTLIKDVELGENPPKIDIALLALCKDLVGISYGA